MHCCPKCGTARAAESTAPCPKCGLAASRMAAFADRVEAAVPEVLRTQWTRVLAGWHTPPTHDELLRLVGQHDAYAWAAARYRDVLREQPDDPVAGPQLERLRKAAEATLMTMATQRREEVAAPYRATRAILLLLVVVALAGLVYAVIQRQRAAARDAADAPLQVNPR